MKNNLNNKPKKNKKAFKNTKPKVIKNTEQPIKKHDVIFDLDHLSSLFKSNNFYTEVPKYLNKFFFKYQQDVFYDDSTKFVLLTREEAKKMIPANYVKQIVISQNEKETTKKMKLSEYFDSDLFLKTNESKLIIDYDKDYKFSKKEFVRGFDIEYNYLNMKKELPLDYNKTIDMTKDVEEGIEMFFNHMKTALCSDIEEEFKVVKRFFASSVMGHKLKIALMLQTLKEQVGKGTVLNFMKELLGNRMHKSSNVEEVTNYTKNFEGCTLINLDEVPIAGSIKTYADCLKSLITEPLFHCREMRQQPYQQRNTFNIVLSSNNNSVLMTQSNNVRYYIPTCSNKLQHNIEYFTKLYNYLAREDVKIGIFQRFKKIYEEEVKPINWSGANEELTIAKSIKIIESLPAVVKYIKNEYLLNKKELKIPVKDFETEYKITNPRDRISLSTIGHYMSELNIECKRVNNKEYNGRIYAITYENLKKAFENKNWLTELEKEELEDNEKTEEVIQENPIDQGIENQESKYLDKIKELEDKLKLLEEENKAFKSRIKKLKKNKQKVKQLTELTSN